MCSAKDRLYLLPPCYGTVAKKHVSICSCLPRTYLGSVAWIGFVLTTETREG